MKGKILITIKPRKLGLGMQRLEVLRQRKLISAGCHAHSNAQNS